VRQQSAGVRSDRDLLIPTQTLYAESGTDDLSTPHAAGIQNNFAQHSEVQAQTDSTKDSKQRTGRIILKDEAQRIRAAQSKKGTAAHQTISLAVEIRTIHAYGTVGFIEAGGRGGGRGRTGERRPHALHHPL
jgi:urocanate hydratase